MSDLPVPVRVSDADLRRRVDDLDPLDRLQLERALRLDDVRVRDEEAALVLGATETTRTTTRVTERITETIVETTRPLPGPLPAGWYRDPSGTFDQRWWDGAVWTGQIVNMDGLQLYDPFPSGTPAFVRLQHQASIPKPLPPICAPWRRAVTRRPSSNAWPPRRPPTALEVVRGVHCCDEQVAGWWQRFRYTLAMTVFALTFFAGVGGATMTDNIAVSAVIIVGAIVVAGLGFYGVYRRGPWVCPDD